MLPHFFRHYDPLIERYFFYDDGSTDQTLSILSAHPRVEIRKLPRSEKNSYVLAARELHNSCWKESRGQVDWVIYTAVDEFLYAPDLAGYLEECTLNGITAILAIGYQMISRTFPESDKSLLSQVISGCPWYLMNKLSIFDPDEITETNFLPGRHEANLQGNVVYPERKILLNLHFKYLDFDRTFQRHNELERKLGKYDKTEGWGHQYGWSKKQFKKDWDFFEKNAHPDIFDQANSHDSPSLDEQKKHELNTKRFYLKVRTILKNNILRFKNFSKAFKYKVAKDPFSIFNSKCQV